MRLLHGQPAHRHVSRGSANGHYHTNLGAGPDTSGWAPASLIALRATHTYSRSPLRVEPRNPGLDSFHTIRRSARGSGDNLKQALADALPTLSERRMSPCQPTRSCRLPCPPCSSLQAWPSSLASSPRNARAHTAAGRSTSPSADAPGVPSAAKLSHTTEGKDERHPLALPLAPSLP